MVFTPSIFRIHTQLQLIPPTRSVVNVSSKCSVHRRELPIHCTRYNGMLQVQESPASVRNSREPDGGR